MRSRRATLFLIAGLLLLVASGVAYLQPWERWIDAETDAWRLTLVGREGVEKVLTFRELISLPSYVGNGGFFSTVGTIFGPYRVRGVTLLELCRQVGGLQPGEAVAVYARDGYSTVLSYEQVGGGFITYTTALKEVPAPELNTILMYELNRRYLTVDDGKPLRLAIAGEQGGLLTEGNYWVKWVNRIEVLKAR